jgi:hypothetical protein
MSWVKKEGVGKYNGYWHCPSNCKVRFDPAGFRPKQQTLEDPNKLVLEEITNLHERIDKAGEYIVRLELRIKALESKKKD